MKLTLKQALEGLADAESKLSEATAISSPTVISENMYRLGQYASALEKFLGDAEEEYEVEWAEKYQHNLANKYPDGTVIEPGAVIPMQDGDKFPLIIKGLSATAAKQQADVDMAAAKGNIKKLSRYVSAAWRVHTSCMARMKHIEQENRGSI